MGKFLTWGPPKCGICKRTTNCNCGKTPKAKVAKPETKRGTSQVKTPRGTVISHTAAVKTGNITKNGNVFCGKCRSRIVNGVHSGRCES